jgi:hypothetical protein
LNFAGLYSVVPIAVERPPLYIYLCDFFLANLDLRFVFASVKFGSDCEARFCCRATNQVHDHLMACQRAASPVLCYLRKQPVLYFVPFARSRRKVTDGDLDVLFIRQLLYGNLPNWPFAGFLSEFDENQQHQNC